MQIERVFWIKLKTKYQLLIIKTNTFQDFELICKIWNVFNLKIDLNKKSEFNWSVTTGSFIKKKELLVKLTLFRSSKLQLNEATWLYFKKIFSIAMKIDMLQCI